MAFFPPIPIPTVGVLNQTNLFSRPWYDWLRQWTTWATEVELVITVFPQEDSGLFFPVITGTGSNPTVVYSHQEGFWIRVGHMVTFHSHMIITSISGGSGDAQTNLPFIAHTAGGPTNYDPTLPAFTSNVDWGTGRQFLYARVLDGTTLMDFISVGNNSTAVPMALSGFSAGSEVAISATYWTDAP